MTQRRYEDDIGELNFDAQFGDGSEADDFIDFGHDENDATVRRLRRSIDRHAGFEPLDDVYLV